MLYNQQEQENSNCSFCGQEFMLEGNAVPIALKCGDAYCTSCVSALAQKLKGEEGFWFICPTCKMASPVDSELANEKHFALLSVLSAFAKKKSVRKQKEDQNAAIVAKTTTAIEASAKEPMQRVSISLEQNPEGELEKDLRQNLEELDELLAQWMAASKELGVNLNALKEEMIKHHKNAHIAKISGHSTAAVGGALMVAGAASAFFTFGTSLALTAGGAALATAGNITSSGAMLAEWKLLKKLGKRADALFHEQAERSRLIAERLNTIEGLVARVLELQLQQKTKRGLTAAEGRAELAIQLGTVAWTMGAIAYNSANSAFYVGRALYYGALASGFIGGTALDGFRQIASFPLMSATSGAAQGATVVGGVLAAVTVPVDVAFAGWSVYRLAVGSVPQKAEELEGLIDILEASVAQVEAAAAGRDLAALLGLFPASAAAVEAPMKADETKERKEREKKERREEKRQKREQKKMQRLEKAEKQHLTPSKEMQRH